MASATVGKGWTGIWLRSRDRGAPALPPKGHSGVIALADPAAVPTPPAAAERPRLIAAAPPFDRAPDGALVPLGSILGDSNEVSVSSGSHHLFVYLPAGTAGASILTASCEIDFFEAAGTTGERRRRYAHYVRALPSANSDGRYHAFRIVAPKDAAIARARFVGASAGSEIMASADMFLVPTAKLTYAATDLANDRYFCPIPIGRLHCYFTTTARYLFRIAAELGPGPSSSNESEEAAGKAIFQADWGTAADARARTEKTKVAPVSMPFDGGIAGFEFRATGPRVVVAVEFADVAPGIALKKPIAAEQAGPDFPAEYLAYGDNFFETRYKTAKEAFSRLKFPEASLTATQLISSPRIIGVVGEFLRMHLRAFSGFTPMGDEDAMEAINDSDAADTPGIVLIESLFYREGQSWLAPGTTALTEDPRLQDLLRIAGRRGWTRVFWFSEESVHFEAFAGGLDLFDRVIGEAEITKDPLQSFSEKIVNCLPFVDVRLANPLLALPPTKDFHRTVRALRGPLERKTLIVGWADLLEGTGLDQILDEPVLPHVHIGEDLWKFRANKIDDIPTLIHNIIGYLSQTELVTAYKYYGSALFFYPSLRSEAALLRNVLVAASCNCLPIVYCVGQNRPDNPLLEEVALVADDQEQVRQLIVQIAEDDLALARRRHLIWRFAASYNASGRRVAEALGVECNQLPAKTEDGLVAIITPTKRPELLTHAYQGICEQQHPTWEWIIVINRRDFSPSELPDQIRADARVRVVTAAPSKNIGFCLELGISVARGALWVKWDDDDFYGPGYLSDTLLLSRMTTAELIGRPPSYFFLERDGGLYKRPGAVAAFTLSPENFQQTGLVSGASLTGRVSGMRSVRFDLDWRSSVDTHYMDAIINSGLTICSGPNFGLVAFRAADRTKHTWRAPELALTVNTERVGGERELYLALA